MKSRKQIKQIKEYLKKSLQFNVILSIFVVYSKITNYFWNPMLAGPKLL